MHIKRTLSGVAASAALAAMLGCGGGDAQERTAQATPSPTAAAEMPAPKQDLVTIEGYEFRPKRLTVQVGERVTWVDKDAANHTVTFEGGPGDLGNVDPNERVSTKFSSPGTYSYVCTYHPNMRGTVVVK
jgi:plastocyanin